jgi:cytoskeletal protein CcmA (bactofilin family)
MAVHHQTHSPRRRGFASVIAMLYVVLFSVLALGFFAAMTMSAQVARNQRNVEDAMLPLDSGMQFMRYQFSLLNISASTPTSSLLSTVETQLAQNLNGQSNMNGDVVALNNGTINIPGNTSHYISLDPNLPKAFRADITQSGTFLVMKVTAFGADSTVTRAAQIQYTTAPRASAIFDYGVAAKGPIAMSGNVKIQGATNPAMGSVLSATVSSNPLSITGNGSISGDFSYTNSGGTPTYGTGTIAGYTSTNLNFLQHVHSGVTAPPFPSIDTSAYAQYATSTFSGGTSNVTLTNAIIPPNTNPSFSGNSVIQGVLYVQSPNKVSFSGNLTITGCIVVANNPTGSANTLNFSGNVHAASISTLPANSTFPAGERALTGAFLLAPDFAVTFSGNFGTIGGSMIADSFNFSGNAGGTVNGSVVALKDTSLVLSGNSDIIIASTGTTNYPTGVSFGNDYVPVPGSYLELLP